MKLDPKKLDAINLLVYNNCSSEEAAKAVGVHVRTVQRWRNEEEFKKVYFEELNNKVDTIRNQFKENSNLIYEELLGIMLSSDTMDKDKINLGKYMLDQAVGKSEDKISINQSVTSKIAVDEQDILDIFENGIE